MNYIISYDIQKDKIRNKAAKLLTKYGLRVQYSVFECLLTTNDYQILFTKLSALVNHKTDSVIFYPVCKNCENKKEVIGSYFTQKKSGIIEI
jgi:CRISPR-associated protein Cas2